VFFPYSSFFCRLSSSSSLPSPFSIANDLSFSFIGYVCYSRTRASQLQMCDSDSKLFFISCVYITDSRCTHFFFSFFPFISPRSRYAQRLQSNLTWLAAAADHGKQGVSFYFLFFFDRKGPLSLSLGGPCAYHALCCFQ
jgi:hypothetical protein